MDPLTTERLRLRPFTLDDVDAMVETYGDLAVMRYVGHGVAAGRLGVRRMLRQYIAHQERHGFSVWAIVEQGRDVLIGDAGLYTRPDGATELGYTLRQQSWHRGYATEAGRAWVSAAFGPLGLDGLVAQTDPPNVASQRVLEKLGFSADGTRMAYGREHRFFTLAIRAACG